MRNCDNCIYGSYGLDCNTGTETLYCGIYGYEWDVMPEDLCPEHQFIDGYGNEKNYVLYDESYLGKGYFIINEINNKIKKFIKIYTINSEGVPHYYLRSFGLESRDNPDSDYTNTEFVFRSMEDYENGLYNIFLEFAKGINGNITTIDEYYEGTNNISFVLNYNGIVGVVVSKDIWRGRGHPTDFIDINIGDNYTCVNYDAVDKFYNSLGKTLYKEAKTEDIKKILKLTL